jgi:hypothetical protein
MAPRLGLFDLGGKLE